MANNLSIEKNVLDKIKATLDEVLPAGGAAYLFGSRANGTAKPFSDVDIALDNSGRPMPEEAVQSLRASFESSKLPYEVDIVDLNLISDEFRAAIEEDLIRLHSTSRRPPQMRMPI